MKKFLPMIVLIILGLLIIWFFWFRQPSATPSAEKNTSAGTTSETSLPKAEEKNAVIGSIQDAMGLGKKMKCEYSAKDGNGASTIFVDGQKFKSTSEVDGVKMYGLFDGTTQYTWTSNDKQGWKMDKTCLDGLSESVPDVTQENGDTESSDQPTNKQDLRDSFAAAQNAQCSPATGEDFSVPMDIVFADQCQMIKDSKKALEQMKDKLPSGFKVPGY